MQATHIGPFFAVRARDWGYRKEQVPDGFKVVYFDGNYLASICVEDRHYRLAMVWMWATFRIFEMRWRVESWRRQLRAWISG